MKGPVILLVMALLLSAGCITQKPPEETTTVGPSYETTTIESTTTVIKSSVTTTRWTLLNYTPTTYFSNNIPEDLQRVITSDTFPDLVKSLESGGPTTTSPVKELNLTYCPPGGEEVAILHEGMWIIKIVKGLVEIDDDGYCYAVYYLVNDIRELYVVNIGGIYYGSEVNIDYIYKPTPERTVGELESILVLHKNWTSINITKGGVTTYYK